MNYQFRAGSIICDTAGGLAALSSHAKVPGGSAATWVAADSTDPAFLRPTGATKVFRIECTDHGGGIPAYRFDWVINEPLSAISTLSVPVYVNGSFSSVVLTASEDTGFTKNYAFDGTAAPNTNKAAAGWTTYHFTKPVYTVTGVPVETNNWTRIRLTITLTTSTTRTVYVGPIYKNWYNVPRVAFVFDDGDDTHYTEAYPYMAARGMRGSLALNKNSGDITAQQLRTLYDAGWSFHNHGLNHVDLSTISSDEVQLASEVLDNQAWLNGLGYTKGASDFVYPNGNTNETVKARLSQMGYRSAWTTVGKAESVWDSRLDEPMASSRFLMDSTITLASLKQKVDRVIGSGMCAVFYGHPWVNGAAGAQTEIATGKGLVDYLYTKQVKVVTLDELVDGITVDVPRIVRV